LRFTREDIMTIAARDRVSDHLTAFLGAYRQEFRRRDQVRWAAVYLQGLLVAQGRRNVENLARAVRLAEEQTDEDVTQALGHFVHHSPWDEEQLWWRHHERLAERPARGGWFVLEELTLIKQGRHSVGVQRQFSRALGRKVNCQLAVVLHHVGCAGHLPLAVRLYLPRAWLLDGPRLDLAGVPLHRRQSQDRLAIGLDLLDQARAAALEADGLAAGPGWQLSEDMARAAGDRGLACRAGLPPGLAALFEAGRQRLDELGLEHFEGRSWRGFHHHACLVTLAHAFAQGCPLEFKE
jgi:SRSO17 transposase